MKTIPLDTMYLVNDLEVDITPLLLVKTSCASCRTEIWTYLDSLVYYLWVISGWYNGLYSWVPVLEKFETVLHEARQRVIVERKGDRHFTSWTPYSEEVTGSFRLRLIPRLWYRLIKNFHTDVITLKKGEVNDTLISKPKSLSTVKRSSSLCLLCS